MALTPDPQTLLLSKDRVFYPASMQSTAVYLVSTEHQAEPALWAQSKNNRDSSPQSDGDIIKHDHAG